MGKIVSNFEEWADYWPTSDDEPIAVGTGRRLLEDTPTHRLRLESYETFSTGVLNLSYAPADA